jgi:hypothetical protein
MRSTRSQGTVPHAFRQQEQYGEAVLVAGGPDLRIGRVPNYDRRDLPQSTAYD